jgi:poly-gamma-glutamate capsule biosynthesis protein CapA/YwtB (metallophosphatase superfamily)
MSVAKVNDSSFNGFQSIDIMPVRSIISLFLFLPVFSSGQGSGQSELKLSLLFTGDIMGHDSQIIAAENTESKTYSYDEVFRYVKPLLSGADFAAANLEVTLAGPPYKGYPQFSSPSALASACRNAGIDCLVTANNHSADRGKEGIRGTINRLDSIGILHTGTFLDGSSRENLQPLMIKKNGISVALLNYTYGTNGIEVHAPEIVNMIAKNLIAIDIEKARSMNPDIILLYLHWGTEYDTIPSENQSDIAGYLFSKGADIIIGSHPHVLQKMVLYRNNDSIRDKAVVYSLGNFVSNQRKPKTDGGSMVRIELTKTGNSVRISDAGYYLTWVYTPRDNDKRKFFILPCSEFEKNPGFFSNPDDYLQMQKFINDSRTLLYKQNTGFREYVYNDGEWLLNN